MKKNHPILKLIEEGEHQNLDFKFEISDAAKIARSFVAFANTKGGKLLIGVNDDGSIAGTQTEEELFMAEAAANKYVIPKISFKSKKWNIDGKHVLEITIPESIYKPHFTKSKSERPIAYLRVDDENIKANTIWVMAMHKKYSEIGTFIKYTKAEEELLKYLEKYPKISLGGVMELTAIKQKQAEEMLTDLIAVDVLEISFNGEEFIYSLKTL